jgi:serine/threonine protein phosphatase 1
MPAFVGDVHGRSDKLREVLQRLASYTGSIVFLGDYVNYGDDARGVLDLLVAERARRGPRLVVLEGNHDAAFRSFLDGGDIGTFLALGGAATVRSYVESIGPDVTSQLRNAVPASHRKLLNNLLPEWSEGNLLAMHKWPDSVVHTSDRFVVLGHYLQPAGQPRITETEAYIDTGCGSRPDGTLTCLLMPDRDWFIV